MNTAILIYVAFVVSLAYFVQAVHPNADVLGSELCAFYVDTCYMTACRVDVPQFCAYGDGNALSSSDDGQFIPTLSHAETGITGPVFTYAHWTD